MVRMMSQKRNVSYGHHHPVEMREKTFVVQFRYERKGELPYRKLVQIRRDEIITILRLLIRISGKYLKQAM